MKYSTLMKLYGIPDIHRTINAKVKGYIPVTTRRCDIHNLLIKVKAKSLKIGILRAVDYYIRYGSKRECFIARKWLQKTGTVIIRSR